MRIHKPNVFRKQNLWKLIAFAFAFMILPVNLSLNAQSDYGRTWNVAFGAGVTPLVGDVSGRLNTGWSITAGGECRFSAPLGLRLDFMYNDFGVSQSILTELSVPAGVAHMNSITVDPVWHFKTSGRVRGYALGGVGFYRRTVEFLQPTTAVVDVFDPWWGYVGPAAVPVDRILGSVTSDAAGVNAGVGLNTDLGHWAGFFIEVRYHYAATYRTATQIVPVTFGFRF